MGDANYSRVYEGTHFPRHTEDASNSGYVEMYPILWGGHPARPVHRTQRMPIPQEIVGDFFNWKSLKELIA